MPADALQQLKQPICTGQVQPSDSEGGRNWHGTDDPADEDESTDEAHELVRQADEIPYQFTGFRKERTRGSVRAAICGQCQLAQQAAVDWQGFVEAALVFYERSDGFLRAVPQKESRAFGFREVAHQFNHASIGENFPGGVIGVGPLQASSSSCFLFGGPALVFAPMTMHLNGDAQKKRRESTTSRRSKIADGLLSRPPVIVL